MRHQESLARRSRLRRKSWPRRTHFSRKSSTACIVFNCVTSMLTGVKLKLFKSSGFVVVKIIETLSTSSNFSKRFLKIASPIFCIYSVLSRHIKILLFLSKKWINYSKKILLSRFSLAGNFSLGIILFNWMKNES